MKLLRVYNMDWLKSSKVLEAETLQIHLQTARMYNLLLKKAGAFL
jgi:hypothetical protein